MRDGDDEATTSLRRTCDLSIDGRKVKSVKDFYREIGCSVNGPGGYFGRNLDALADCLRGGFGTPENRLTSLNGAQRCIAPLPDGRATRAAPVFDSVRDVFDDAGVTLQLR